jgi:hypothetical protein
MHNHNNEELEKTVHHQILKKLRNQRGYDWLNM